MVLNPIDAQTNQGGLVRMRTFVLVAVPLALPFLYTFFYVPSNQMNALRESAKQKAKVTSAVFAANVAAPMAAEDLQALNLLAEATKADPDLVFVAAYKNDGASGREVAKFALQTAPPSMAQKPKVTDVDAEDHEDFIYVAAPVRKDVATAPIGWVQAAFSTKSIQQEGADFRLRSTIISLLVLLLAGAMAVFLGRNFAGLFEQLRRSMLQTAKRVDDLVNQLAAVTAEQTSAASEESTALHESNSTAADVGQAATNAAMRASALIEGGARAEEGAASGLDSVGSAIQAMRQVREQMNTIGNTVSALSERAATIGEIASTVALLAERSNLLALNAAIEAARAGTQGRGFAVVAQEMRSLADGSNRSAGQVKSIIAEIQSAIIRAVGDAREGERRVQNAESLADRAGENIRSFAETTREFAKLGKEIAASANQQSVAIEQMVESISHATQAGSTQLETTKQVEETARQLRQLSREMLDVAAGKAAITVPPAA